MITYQFNSLECLYEHKQCLEMEAERCDVIGKLWTMLLSEWQAALSELVKKSYPLNILSHSADTPWCLLSIYVHVCVLIFLPALLCVSAFAFAGVVYSHFRCICVGFPLYAAVWMCQSLSLVEPIVVHSLTAQPRVEIQPSVKNV